MNSSNSPSFAPWWAAFFAAALLSACGNQQEAKVPATVPSPPPPSEVAPRIAPAAVPDSVVAAMKAGTGRPRPLVLKSGQVATGTLVAPRAGSVVAFDLKLGNYYDSSTGLLTLQLCHESDQRCVGGSGDLQSSRDNQMFTVVLDQPLDVAAGDGLTFRLEKDGGDQDVVIWTYPSVVNSGQTISLRDGKPMKGRTAQLALRFARLGRPDPISGA